MFNQDNLQRIIYAINNRFYNNTDLNGTVPIGLDKEIVLDINDNIVYHDYYQNRNNVLLLGTLKEQPELIMARLLLLNNKYYLDTINDLDVKNMKEREHYEYATRTI